MCLIVPLCAGMASMLRFVVALSPLVLLGAQLLSRPTLLFAGALAAMALCDYFFTIGWLSGWLALV